MIKSDLVKKVADEAGLPRTQVARVIDTALAAIVADMAAGNDVVLAGFGAFTVKERAPREVSNPRKPGEKILVGAHRAPGFRAGKHMRDAVSGEVEKTVVGEAKPAGKKTAGKKKK